MVIPVISEWFSSHRSRIAVLALGFAFLAPVMALPVLSVTPAGANPVTAISDFDHDGRLDLQLSDGTYLYAGRQGEFTGAGAVMTDSGPAPATYALSNGTPIPSDTVSRTLNTSYLSKTGSSTVLVMTPYSENVTVYELDARGVYHPAVTMDLRAASLRELTLRPTPDYDLEPEPVDQEAAAA
jgi:hypothetical protein